MQLNNVITSQQSQKKKQRNETNEHRIINYPFQESMLIPGHAHYKPKDLLRQQPSNTRKVEKKYM